MIKYFLNKDMQTINWFKSAAVVALMAFSLSSLANEDKPALKPFEAEYTGIRWGNDVGKATLKLAHLAADTYSLTYSSKASVFFFSDKRKEHSIFAYDDGTFVPKEYYYSRSGTGKDKSLALKFDPASQTIDVDNKTEMEWNNEWDNQLYRLDLAQKLAAGVDEIDYDFVNYRGEKRHYKIVVEGTESLDLPYGKIDAIKVKLVRESKKRLTYAWFAPTLDYNLVRLQQFKDGDEQGDIRLKRYQLL